MAYLFLLISVIAGSAKSMVSKLLSPYSGTKQGFGKSNALLSLSACAVIAAVGLLVPGNGGGISLYTFLTGLLFGLCSTVAQLFYMRAMARGTVSVVTFVYSCGFLIPTVAGTLFWSEPVSLPLGIGVLLLLVAFVLCAQAKSASTEKTDSRPFAGILPALAAMCCSGILGILQKIHQSSVYQRETTGFLVTAFLLSSALSLVLCSAGKKQTDHEKTLLPGKAVLFAVIGGLFIGAANIVNLRLSGMLPAALCFPVTNGGVVTLSAIIGRILFRERLSKRGYLGILLGVVAIVVIGLGK